MTQGKHLIPPPWLIAMQRYGPPPSYPNLKIPGLNAAIPEVYFLCLCFFIRAEDRLIVDCYTKDSREIQSW